MSFSVVDTNWPSGRKSDASPTSFHVGVCRVTPDLNRISGPGGETVVEPKSIAVLVYLAERPGQVVSAEHLIDAIWAGRPMGENPVYRCISQLRRALGDDPHRPSYIATVPTKGYRLVATVSFKEPGSPDDLPASSAAPGAETMEVISARAGRARTALRVLLPLILVLFTALTAGYWLSNRGTTPPSAASVPTLAVVPFINQAGAGENSYFTDGLSDEILNHLTHYRQLRVIARSSSFAFKDSDANVPRIARLLGVEYVLQGEVRLVGDRLRVTATLVDHEGFQVWGETFENPVTEKLTIQSEIAKAVAMSILPRITALPTVDQHANFEAYQQYFIGREMMIRRPQGYLEAALRHLNEAIKIDPEFADAYAVRATTSIWGAEVPGFDETISSTAQRDIDRALAIDPGSAQAYAAQGLLFQILKPHDLKASETALNRALSLDPYLVNAWNWLSRSLREQGRNDEADEALQNAARIDPLAPSVGANLARSEAKRGQIEAAERRLRRLMSAPHSPALVSGGLIDLLFQTGRLSEALEVVRASALGSAESNLMFEETDYLNRIFATLGVWDRADYWGMLGDQIDADGPLAHLDWAAIELETAYPGYAQSAGTVEERVKTAGLEIPETPIFLQANLGALLALAGEYQRALALLEHLIDPQTPTQYLGSGQEINIRHALAWAWMQTGKNAQAQTLLRKHETLFQQVLLDGRLHRSADLFDYARNQVLLGETNQALDLLEQAELAGWRGYYQVLHDPRWAALNGAARFQEMMTRIKAKLAEQRARIESLEADNVFGERIEVSMRLKTQES